ncbi:MAG: electron transfer flavoprotein subunit beta/FixA family protein [Ardenticatenaceae bacterium]|nr:electron transfer flavoprotein subunit beta/FixA family protein [Anaerolineales bacterium]MCB9009543.1 electron transfer flavoprotein subunit beta/FixA family protein [Ardenticatenaceae bacterium]
MEILVCVKRVPTTGAKIVLTEDARAIETRNLGFTISPHEECAVEEAVQLVEKHGGSVTVLTLGSPEATQQIRDAMAVGADKGILLETAGEEWDPVATGNAIVDAIKASGSTFDLLLFGNEAADSGDYQVGVRVAHALDVPCVTGIKGLAIEGDTAVAKREAGGGFEIYEIPLPAVITVKEGLNLPRYPSVPGRLRAKKKPLETATPERNGGGLEMVKLVTPQEQSKSAEVLGSGVTAVPKIVELLRELKFIE